jgi:hypothetical protein
MDESLRRGAFAFSSIGLFQRDDQGVVVVELMIFFPSSKERLVLNSPCPFPTLESAIGTGRGRRDRGKKLIQIGPVL